MESGLSGKTHGKIAGIAQKHLVLDSAAVHTILRPELVSSETYTADIAIATTAANTIKVIILPCTNWLKSRVCALIWIN